MSWVWRHGPSDPTERLVLLALADHANDEGQCHPSMAGIAAKSCVTERGARGILRRLEAAGWVATKVGGGRGGKSSYTVLMAENPEPKFPLSVSETRNEKPGTRNPEYETRNDGSAFTGQNPERGDTKPGTSVPPNHHRTITKKERKNPPTPQGGERVHVAAILSEVASQAAVNSFIAYRARNKSKALTVTGATRLAGHLRAIFASGGDPDDALAMAEEKAWLTVEPDWYFKQKGNQNGNGNRLRIASDRREDRVDPALEQIARLAGLGQAQGNGRG